MGIRSRTGNDVGCKISETHRLASPAPRIASLGVSVEARTYAACLAKLEGLRRYVYKTTSPQ